MKNHLELTEEIQSVCGSHYLNQFSLNEAGDIIVQKNSEWKMKCYESIFESLLKDSKTLFLDEMSGLHSIIAKNKGVGEVFASSGNPRHIQLIQDLSEYKGVAVGTIPQPMVVWGEGNPLVDTDFRGSFDYVFCGNTGTYVYYKKLGQNFKDVVKSLSFYANKGLVIQWQDVTWEEAPEDYNLESFRNVCLEYYNSFIKTIDGLIILV